ncbi:MULTISPECIES: contact-dependent growth inhibition system immunity protein [unclassified Microcoleus]|uniref:contact-dependent growth inhibition system immunity protein n=1 Tax=unclassified Microcoleus TaxID=2642155 RepID=UPI00312B6DB0
MNDRFPELTQFFSSYFHQDWPLEASNASEVVENYLHSESPETIEAVLAELNQLLKMSIAEPDLETLILEELGCYYDPSSENQTVTEWLESVQQSLSNAS